ncbi:MAG: hypothetical protein U0929_19210 [Planctomycetaceae bacterium]
MHSARPGIPRPWKIGTIGELTTNSFASAGLGDTQLQGVTFATGLTW